MSWPLVSFSKALETAPIFVDGDWVESKDQDPDGDVRLIQLADVGDGFYVDKSNRFLTSAAARRLKCTFIEPGDVLIARMPDPLGRACIFPGDSKRAVTVVDVCVIRVDPSRMLGRWLMHCINSPTCRQQIDEYTTGTTRQRISRGNLGKIHIPLPPLPEQRRIAAILDQADTLRTQRRAALAQLDSLTQSLFLDMFGDPVTNPKCWPFVSLTDVCHCYSGGTPSKANNAFWDGTVPWFSAKDMKAEDLFDSEDHIAEAVPQTTTLKLLPKDTVAIVVRGMILAHTFPVCVLRIPATINQDLKALIPREPINAQFLAACLRSQSGSVLEQVSEAGHGTKRLDAQGLQKIRVLRPGSALEQTFATRVQAIEALKAQHRAALAEADALFAALQQRAFAGDLSTRPDL